MRLPTLAEAIDDYLHLVVRVRPWTKKREEEALLGFAEWLGGSPPDRRGSLLGLTPALARRSAAERDLDARETEQLVAALHNLLAWGCAEGLLEGRSEPVERNAAP